MNSGQMQLSLFEVARPNPLACKHEQSVVDIGGGKTLCAAMGMWTNCREVGHCTAKDGELLAAGENHADG